MKRLKQLADTGEMPSAEEFKKEEKTPAEQVEHGIKTVLTLYTETRAPGVAKTCFKTCSTFMANVLKDQDNMKFRKINLENNAVKTRVS